MPHRGRKAKDGRAAEEAATRGAAPKAVARVATAEKGRVERDRAKATAEKGNRCVLRFKRANAIVEAGANSHTAMDLAEQTFAKRGRNRCATHSKRGTAIVGEGASFRTTLMAAATQLMAIAGTDTMP